MNREIVTIKYLVTTFVCSSKTDISWVFKLCNAFIVLHWLLRVQSLHWKDPWRSKQQPTSVSLPGESHGGAGRLQSMGSQIAGHDWSSLAQHATKSLTYGTHFAWGLNLAQIRISNQGESKRSKRHFKSQAENYGLCPSVCLDLCMSHCVSLCLDNIAEVTL